VSDNLYRRPEEQSEGIRLITEEMLDPPRYVERQQLIHDIDSERVVKVDISRYIAENIANDEGNVYVMWGLPGSGKSTIARQVARHLITEKKWRALHIMLRYESRPVLPLSYKWETPPAIILDSRKLDSQCDLKSNEEGFCRYLYQLIEQLARGPRRGVSNEAYLNNIVYLIEKIFDNSGEGIDPRMLAKFALMIPYLLGVIPIDISEIVDKIDIRTMPRSFHEIVGFLDGVIKGNLYPNRAKVLIILDDVSDDYNKIKFVNELLKVFKNKLDIYFLVVITINESQVIELLKKSSAVDWSHIYVKYIASKLEKESVLLEGAIHPKYIGYPTLEEIREIIASFYSRDVVDRLGDDMLAKIASCSGWHISLILNNIKITGGSIPRDCNYPKTIMRIREPKPEIINIINRFLQLKHLVARLVSMDLAFIALLLQPMGVSRLEIEKLCEKLKINNKYSKYINKIIESNASPDCSYHKLDNLVDRGWNDIIARVKELWCDREMLSLKVGTPFYHIPMLLTEYEKSIYNKKEFKEILKKYYRVQASDRYWESIIFYNAIKYVRSELLAVEKELFSKGLVCSEKTVLKGIDS